MDFSRHWDGKLLVAEFTPASRRPIWSYAYADWEKACELIDNTNWDSLCSDDIRSNWQQQFMSIIEECIPKGVLPPE